MHSLSSFFTTLSVMLVFGLATTAWGQIRSSSNYQIERDSVNVGGGLGTSGSYALESSVGEVATGRSTSSSFILTAGFQQQPEVTLALTGGSNVMMDAAIGGVTGGTSNGSTTVVASTNGAAGYQLTIQASQSPAMQSTSSDTIADYVPAGASPDLNFTTSASEAHFGFSPFGPDVTDRYRVSGGVCGSGSASSTACWDGLSITPITIASQAGANAPAGASTTLYFRVGVGGSVIQSPGTYTATTTVTLISL
jgi:hypothetical protein